MISRLNNHLLIGKEILMFGWNPKIMSTNVGELLVFGNDNDSIGRPLMYNDRDYLNKN